MPSDYPVSQLVSDMMSVISEAMIYVVPAACITAAAALVIRWFMYAINVGDWTFGNRK